MTLSSSFSFSFILIAVVSNEQLFPLDCSPTMVLVYQPIGLNKTFLQNVIRGLMKNSIPQSQVIWVHVIAVIYISFVIAVIFPC